MGRRVVGAMVSLALSGAIVVAAASPAAAVKPVKQACVGQTFSSAEAHPLGHLISGFAQEVDSRPGIGDGIQGLQGGFIPDDLAPNTCN